MRHRRWCAWWRRIAARDLKRRVAARDLKRRAVVRDLTGPATIYPNQTGAYAPGYRPNQMSGPPWDQPTAIRPQIGPLMTPGQRWRGGGWRS